MSKKRALIVSLSLIAALGAGAYIAADYYLFEHVAAEVKPSVFEERTQKPVETVFTETSYKSGKFTVEITEFTEGEGDNVLAYYVADVRLYEPESFATAFAKDKFGRNIREAVSVIAERNGAILAINGDYYGYRTDGVTIRNGVLYRDEPTRECLAIYRDGSAQILDERLISAEQMLADGVVQTVSFGPALFKNGEIPNDLDKHTVDITNTIQGKQPRTGIGEIDRNHWVFVVADGRQKTYSLGLDLQKFAEIFKSLGCETAYNLDGGGSSEMWFMGRVVNRPCNKNNAERETSDIIFLG